MRYDVPFTQLFKSPFGNGPEVYGILVEASGDPAQLIAPIQRLVDGSSDVPVYARVGPCQALLDPRLRSWKLGARG